MARDLPRPDVITPQLLIQWMGEHWERRLGVHDATPDQEKVLPRDVLLATAVACPEVQLWQFEVRFPDRGGQCTADVLCLRILDQEDTYLAACLPATAEQVRAELLGAVPQGAPYDWRGRRAGAPVGPDTVELHVFAFPLFALVRDALIARRATLIQAADLEAGTLPAASSPPRSRI